MKGTGTVSVVSLINDRQMTSTQVRVFVFAALSALLDGADSQVIGVAAPLMAQQMHMPMSRFAPALAAGLLGAAIGAIVFGPIADRLGRKPMLVGTTLVMGACTVMTALAHSFTALLIWRVLAGLGLGGAIPCFITLSAEYSPKTHRATLASVLWAGYPAGIAVGGFMSSYLIRNYDWSSLFYVTGVATLFVSLLILLLVPESLLFLVTRRRLEQARRLVSRLYPEIQVAADKLVTDGAAAAPSRQAPVAELFRHGRAIGTLLIWVILFLAFATTTVVVLMTPTLLRQVGIDLSTTAMLIGTFSVGSVISMASAGRLVAKFGPIRALVPPFVIAAVALGILGTVTFSVPLLGICMLVLGLTAPLGASGTIALATIYYPTQMRSAGVGWGMGFGRFGQVSTPLLTGLFLGLGWHTPAILWVAALGPVFAGLAVIARTLLLGKAGTAQVVH